MMRRTRTAATLLGAAIVAGVAVPAAADARPFGPAQVAVGGCAPAEAGADAVTTPDGATRGFASCGPDAGPVRFFERAGDGTVRRSEGTGVTGDVLAVAADGTATYVLFRDRSTLHVGKRTAAGAFSSRVVAVGLTALAGADIVARDGRWFGVWSTLAGRANPLVEAGTDLAPRRITAPAAGAYDASPALAHDGAVPVLVWARGTSRSAGSDLWTARRVGGRWQSSALATAGGYNSLPDVAVAGGTRFVTWTRDGYVLVASDRGGSWTTRRFAVPVADSGGYSQVAASTAGGDVDAVFVTYLDRSLQTFFAESRGTGGAVTGTWHGRPLTAPSDGVFQPPVAVGAAAGKATVTYRGRAAVSTVRQN